MMKKRIALMLSAVMALSTVVVPVYAYEPPQEIWASFNKYAEALDANDYENIIKYGLIDVSILENEPINDTTQSWLCARYQNIAYAYEMLGDYENSAKMYEKQIPLAKTIGWYDSVKVAESKSLFYKSYMDLYVETYEPGAWFGAKNEPKTGVLYGISAASKTNQDNSSMKLIYLEYGDTDFNWIKSVLKTANENGMAVEFALNMPNQGSDIPKVIADNGYLQSVASMLAQYPNVKFFVRFGAEFDIWDNRADPEQYKAAFRKTADIIHNNVENAAMVFSPNMVSSWDINFMDYYPGDEYVDWIGVSLYLMKYFQGIKDRDEASKYMEVVFSSGDSAEPVLMMKKFIDIFGDRKPIMLSESGASHYIYKAGEDATQWAKDRLSRLYNYLPMVYPQIKLIAYFDAYVNNEVNNYALSANKEIENWYNKLTSNDIFIKKNPNNTPGFSYKKLDDTIDLDGDSITLNTYVHVFGKDNLKVNYYLDGKWVGSSGEVPYKKTIDMSFLTGGTHELKVTAEAGGAEVYSKKYTVKKAGDKDSEISVLINGEKLSFDKPPVIIDGRTLVPMRAIFEALGAKVDWENDTKTAIGISKDTQVRIQIGSKKLIKNGTSIELDVEARLIDGKTMVPARAIAEAFGAKVGWDGNTKTVMIDTNN